MAYDARREPEVPVKVYVNKDNHSREQCMQKHWHNDGAMNCAFDEAKCEWPSSWLMS